MPWRQEVTFKSVKRASLLLTLKLINTVICRFWLKVSTTLPVPRGLEKRRFWVTQDNQKSGPFFLLIWLEATNLPTILPNVWAKLPPKNAKSPLPVDRRRTKTSLPKLPTIYTKRAWQAFAGAREHEGCSRTILFALSVPLKRLPRALPWEGNIFSNVKWRWFRRLEVQSRINEVGCWNILTFRHVKTWTVHSISVLSKQTERYATNYEQSEGNACYEGDVLVGVMTNPTLTFALHFYTCIQFAYHRIRINY